MRKINRKERNMSNPTKPQTPLTASELLQVVSNQWADRETIMKISNTGYTTSTKYFKEIQEKVEAEGYRLPTGLVPMEKVVEYFKINLSYLKKVSQNEK